MKFLEERDARRAALAVGYTPKPSPTLSVRATGGPISPPEGDPAAGGAGRRPSGGDGLAGP